jgi:hypothetical protein
MDWLEWLVLGFVVLIFAMDLLVKPVDKWRVFKRYVAFAGFGILLGHLLFDQKSWQMYPVYFYLSMKAGVSMIGLLTDAQRKPIRESRMRNLVIGGIAIGLTGLCLVVFPKYSIPEPIGAYHVGTHTFEITDPNRLESYGRVIDESDKSDYRRIRIQMWYPADSVAGYKQMPWLQDGLQVSRSLAREMNLPFFMLDHTENILSNSHLEAPLSRQESVYPIVILSHGWKGFRSLHTDFAELLASSGYIVFGIDHTYGAQMTVFEDGTGIELDQNALPDRNETPDFLTYANQLVMTYAGDVKLLLDTLPSLNPGQWDLSRVGLLGHSTGGGADVAVAMEDSRVKSVIGLDAWVEPLGMDAVKMGLEVPALFLRSEQWAGGVNDTFLNGLIEGSPEARVHQIDGTTHIDFTMSYLFSSLTGIIGFTGDLDREMSEEIQHTYILNFFNETLRPGM